MILFNIFFYLRLFISLRPECALTAFHFISQIISYDRFSFLLSLLVKRHVRSHRPQFHKYEVGCEATELLERNVLHHVAALGASPAG